MRYAEPAEMFRRRLPLQYREREVSLDAWVALGHDPRSVNLVLNLLSTAFRLPNTDALRLRPDDQVWALYHCYYPRLTGWRRWIGSGPDELEMETLARDLRKSAPPGATIELAPDITVADLVRMLKNPVDWR